MVWAFIEDWAKLMVYRHMGLELPRHQQCLGTAKRGLLSHGR
ncbi:MAG: hypothetical protein WCC36_15135 [Gammaproteobacteria bacterium]